MFGHIKLFRTKLHLWETQLRAENTYHFPIFANYKNFDSATLANELNVLKKEFSRRFQDFSKHEKYFHIFFNPFGVDVEIMPESHL